MRRSSTAPAAPAIPPAASSAPESGPQSVDMARIDALVERYAHVRSIDELPPELRDNPMIRYLIEMTPEQQAEEQAWCEAATKAHELYGDDPSLTQAAIEEGTHPFQVHERRRRDAIG